MKYKNKHFLPDFQDLFCYENYLAKLGCPRDAFVRVAGHGVAFNFVLSFTRTYAIIRAETGAKGPGKRGHIVANTLLPTQMFPRLPARATFVADTKFVSAGQKMFLILFRNILCPQQMFPSLRSPRNIIGNNVSATTCPRLPGP